MDNNTEYIQENSMERQSSLDIKVWLLKILAIWPLIVICLAISLTLAYYKLRSTEPVYQARAIILIKDESRGAGKGIDNTVLQQLGVGSSGVMMENEMELLKSYDLMQKVVKANQLYLTVKHEGRISAHSLYGNDLPFTWEFSTPESIRYVRRWYLTQEGDKWLLQTLKDAKPAKLELGKWYIIDGLKCRLWPNINLTAKEMGLIDWKNYEITLVPISFATRNYQGSLGMRPANEKAAVLYLTMLSTSSKNAEDVLTSLINVYNQMGLNDKNQVTQNTMQFLTARLNFVEDELKGVEGQVAKFKTENRITDISTNAQQYMAAVSDIDRQKALQQTQINVIDALESDLILNQNSPTLVPSSLGIGEPTLLVLIQQHNALILQRDRMKEKAGTLNPVLLDIENQIRDTRKSLIENVKNLRQSYDITLNDIENKNLQLSGRLSQIPQLERNLLEITRDQSVKEQLYLFLLQKREEAAVTLASSIPDSRNIENARSLGQVSPNAGSIWGMAWMLGFLIPIGGLIGIELLNNKVSTAKEVEQKAFVPFLGEISFVKNMEAPIPVLKSGRSIIAEQFRSLRTSISYTLPGKNLQTILITSHRPGEGKSFTCLNLAAGYAILNKKVVILEFDLRKPRVSKNLGLSPLAGISTYLSGNAEMDSLIIKIPNYDGDNFFLFPAGPIPPNPAELILSERMFTMMEELKSRFDYIIFDTPPFSIVTDATLLQKFTELSIVVLRQGYSLKSVYADINKRVTQYPGQPIYTVLNGVGRTQRYNPYGYGYSYGYGYNYGYNEGYYDKQ